MGKIKSIWKNISFSWTELKEKRNEEGLTLIELMVVVVILGIISAIAIPSISGVINNSKINTTESNLSTIQEALQRYYINNNAYPATLSDLNTGTGGPYLDVTFPENDAWSNPIYYAPDSSVSTDGGYYLVSGGTTSDTKTTPSTININDIYAAGGSGTSLTPETPTVVVTKLTLDTVTFADK